MTSTTQMSKQNTNEQAQHKSNVAEVEKS